MHSKSTAYEAKVDLLRSLAGSQRALSRILDSIADISGCSPETAALLRDNVRSLTNMQETMAEAVTGLKWCRRIVKRGVPAKPWLKPSVSVKQNKK